MRNFYDGIITFKNHMRRIFGHQFAPYDWADLSPKERKAYAKREAEKRERRRVPREL